jgi:hypothetical protein
MEPLSFFGAMLPVKALSTVFTMGGDQTHAIQPVFVPKWHKHRRCRMSRNHATPYRVPALR